jgi:hypothetical protein
MSKTASLQPVMAGGRCIGHVVRTARGEIAYDAKGALLGTYSTPEQAIDAISKRTAGAGKREAS